MNRLLQAAAVLDWYSVFAGAQTNTGGERTNLKWKDVLDSVPKNSRAALNPQLADVANNNYYVNFWSGGFDSPSATVPMLGWQNRKTETWHTNTTRVSWKGGEMFYYGQHVRRNDAPAFEKAKRGLKFDDTTYR